MATTKYTDSTISPRTDVYVSKQMLERAAPFLTLEQFGESKPLPSNSSQSIKLRRYKSLAADVKTLTEGVTPSATAIVAEDVVINLVQMGDWVEITDVIQDTHEDPVLSEAADILGEQAAQMVENYRWGQLVLGTNAEFSGATTSNRTYVNAAFSTSFQRKITKKLKKFHAKKITKKVSSTPNYKTENVAPSYVCVTHTDLENDLRSQSAFVPVENYASATTTFEGEIGKIDDVRYIITPLAPIYTDAATNVALNSSLVGTTKNDVYVMLFFGARAFGNSALKNETAIKPVIRPIKADSSDPLGQRGSVGWKSWTGCKILNDAFMCRGEVGCTKLS